MDESPDWTDETLNELAEISRPPTVEDLLKLCRDLNERGARYLVIGGFAIRGAGYLRETYDLDFIIDTSTENEAKVYKSLELLQDKAVRELAPGEVSQYTVVRVADEITVDLMKSASGIDYEEASKEIVMRRVQDIEIPFASPRLLWRMKKNTHREKDAADLLFLKQHYPEVTVD
jgi:hypothetical protein